MEAVAKAISQTERHASATHMGDAGEGREMREPEATLTTKEEREAEARRRAGNFLQAMGNPGGGQAMEPSREGYGRRPGKEPAPTASHAAY